MATAFATAMLGACITADPGSGEGGPIERAATELDEVANRTLKRKTVNFEVTEASRFSHLDIAWYDTATATLRRNGFVRLGDIAPVEHNEQFPAAVLFIRVMASADGTTTAGVFHYWDRSPGAQHLPSNDVRVVDLETEFVDGSFVITSNMPPQAAFDVGPLFDRQIVATTDLVRLWRTHIGHLSDYQAKHPHRMPRTVMTLDDVIAAQKRQRFIAASYRQQMEIPFTEDELNNASDHRFEAAARAVSDVLRSWFPSGW